MSADNEQEAEKVRWLRSRIVQTLNVPLRVRSGLHSLRPCQTNFLNLLLKCFLLVSDGQAVKLHDVLIIGAGLAGMRAAIAAPPDLDCRRHIQGPSGP